jgi:hypothetical protein
MKERFSNTLAWLGFSYLVVIPLSSYMDWWGVTSILIGTKYSIGQPEITFTVLVYVGCAVINYLMVGRFRFLPWLDVADPIPVPFNGKMTKQAKDTIKKVTLVIAGMLIFGFAMIGTRQLASALFS